jgi:hypothetical protein
MKRGAWEITLAAEVTAARSKTFVWGVHDCSLWSFGVVRALSAGPDHAALWRGKYTTAAGAERIRRRLGWADMAEAGTALMGQPLDSVALAQRGDLVVDADRRAFGICVGAVAVFLAPDGLTERPITSCSMAWRV